MHVFIYSFIYLFFASRAAVTHGHIHCEVIVMHALQHGGARGETGTVELARALQLIT